MRLDPSRWLAPAVLLAGLLAFFAPILASGRLIAPGDGIAQNFPMRMLVAEAIRRGEMPFWNPFNFSGTPLLASLQPGVFFPANWTFWFLPGVPAMHVALLLGYAIAGLSAYAFARSLDLGRFPALVTGFTYMLSGYMVLNAQHIVIVHAAALLPLLLWAIERFRTTGHHGYAIAGAGILAFQVFAGHPQMLAYSALLALAYAAFRGIGLPRAAWLPYGGQILLLFVLGAGLSLLQLLPAMDFIRDTQRQAITFGQLTFNTPSPLGAPGMLFSSYLGSRTPSPLLPHPLWPPDTWRWWLQGYVGIGGLLLAGVGLWRWRLTPQALFWGGAATLSLLLVLGNTTPLYRLWALVPVVNQMPYPHRHFLEFTMAIAVLAGLGTAALTEGAQSKRHLAVFVPLATLAAALGAFIAAVRILGPGFAARTQAFLPPGINLADTLRIGQLSFWMPVAFLLALGILSVRLGSAPRSLAIKAGILGLLVLDLGQAGYHNGYWRLSPNPPDLVPVQEAGRSLSITENYYPYYRPIEELVALAQPSLSDLMGVRNIHGYDAFIFKRYGQLLGMNSAGQMTGDAVWRPDHHGFTLLGLKYLRMDAALAQTPQWRGRLTPPRWQLHNEVSGVVTYKFTAGLPPAWRVTNVHTLQAEAVDAWVTRRPGFDPRDIALVEAPLNPNRWAKGPVDVVRRSLNRITLVTTGDGPGFIVVSESFDPGWRASVKGQALSVHRTNALLLGVPVPAGNVEVDLEYEPRLWKLGLAGSIFALLLLVAWSFLRRSKRSAFHLS